MRNAFSALPASLTLPAISAICLALALTTLTPAATLPPLCAAPATPAPAKEKPASVAAAKVETAAVWLANPKRYNGQPVATYIADAKSGGSVPDDAPYAVIRVVTADRQGKTSGRLYLLLPPAEVEATVKALEPRQSSRKTTFGSRFTLQRLDAEFRIVGGENVLVKGGDRSALAKFGKPSVAYHAQQKAAGIPTGKYPQKDFALSQIGKTGRDETQALFNRLLASLNARRKADSQRPLSASDLKREVRNGTEITVDDDTAKTTWAFVEL
ncbi:MAG: hypothetical protein LBT53_07920 [Puniceicoccales bacterium]|jgi:hypothetical protein|nr:hypothetical protein [Puniceicoccales bacterium]